MFHIFYEDFTIGDTVLVPQPNSPPVVQKLKGIRTISGKIFAFITNLNEKERKLMTKKAEKVLVDLIKKVEEEPRCIRYRIVEDPVSETTYVQGDPILVLLDLDRGSLQQDILVKGYFDVLERFDDTGEAFVKVLMSNGKKISVAFATIRKDKTGERKLTNPRLLELLT